METESDYSLVTLPPINQQIPVEGKLWIKLNFPKIEQTTDYNNNDKSPIEASDKANNDHLRVCEICNKGFSSGKALGGHMRIHVQENKNRGNPNYSINRNSMKIKKKSLVTAQHLDSLSEKPICSLCGKTFPSLKSLFGHMRCHPERDYRGIQPPQTGPSNNLLKDSSSACISSVSDEIKTGEEEEEEEFKFPRWSVTARRGRRALNAATSSSSSDDDNESLSMSEEEREAVQDLMMLAKGESVNGSGLTNAAEYGCKDRVFGSDKRRIEDRGCGYSYKKLRINETVETTDHKGEADNIQIPEDNSFDEDENMNENENGVDLDGSVSSDELIMMKLRAKKNINKKKELKFRDLKAVGKSAKRGPIVKYKCNTCNKCFPTHQALGGHRSSHNKSKTNPNQDPSIIPHPLAAREIEETTITAAPTTSTSPPASNSRCGDIDCSVPFQSILTIHECSICHKIFPTGQALGGHKMCHWVGPTEEEEASGTGRVLGFDLNELPPMEDDDFGIYGYASYSHNLVS